MSDMSTKEKMQEYIDQLESQLEDAKNEIENLKNTISWLRWNADYERNIRE